MKGELHMCLTKNNDKWVLQDVVGTMTSYKKKNEAIINLLTQGFIPIGFFYFHQQVERIENENWNGILDNIIENYTKKAKFSLRINSVCLSSKIICQSMIRAIKQKQELVESYKNMEKQHPGFYLFEDKVYKTKKTEKVLNSNSLEKQKSDEDHKRNFAVNQDYGLSVVSLLDENEYPSNNNIFPSINNNPPPIIKNPPHFYDNPPPIYNNPPPIIINPPPIYNNPPPIIINPPLIIDNPSPINNNSPPIINNPPPINKNPPPIINNPPPIKDNPSVTNKNPDSIINNPSSINNNPPAIFIPTPINNSSAFKNSTPINAPPSINNFHSINNPLPINLPPPLINSYSTNIPPPIMHDSQNMFYVPSSLENNPSQITEIPPFSENSSFVPNLNQNNSNN